jgi:uncharacterized protein (TIGR04255 family)
LLEVIIELRFTERIKQEHLPNMLYGAFGTEYKSFEALPLAGVPEQVRTIRPDFAYSPMFRLVSDNFIIQIGPQVFSANRICLREQYGEWKHEKAKLIEIVQKFDSSATSINFERLAFRNVNFFEGRSSSSVTNAFPSIGGQEVTEYDNFSFTLLRKINSIDTNFTQLAGAETVVGDKTLSGTALNIESSITTPIREDLEESIEKLHEVNKSMFFASLKKEYIDALEVAE